MQSDLLYGVARAGHVWPLCIVTAHRTLWAPSEY